MRLLKEQTAQTSLEYLYLTAFVIGLGAIVALLVTDVLAVQEQAQERVGDVRNKTISKIIQ